MAQHMSMLVRTLLALLGITAVGLGIGALGIPGAEQSALGLAVALVALSMLTLVAAIVLPGTAQPNAPHPLRAIDPSAFLPQSDPDAAGHPRPRAPGAAVAVSR